MSAHRTVPKERRFAPAGSGLGPGLIRPALYLLLTLLGAIAVVGVSQWYLQREMARAAQALQSRDQALRDIRQVENDKRDMRRFGLRFIELQAMGLIGAEKRLDWVEAIRQIQAGRKLLPIAYEIEAQQPFKLDGQVDAGTYQLRGSKMVLHMDLLHEMDLLNFLDDLKRRGFFIVQNCAIKRIAAHAAQASSLIADCTLNWLTLGTPVAAASPPGKGP